MNSYLRVCFASFLMFVSQYMLIPVLPVVLAGELEISIASAGKIFLILTAGMIFAGPLYSYLIDTYRRKNLCFIAFAVMILVTIGYYLLNRTLEIWVLPFVQGVFFGIATSSLTTICIDLTPSDSRSKGNMIFGWFTRLGMIFGIALGSLIYLNNGFESIILLSVSFGLVGLLFIASVHVPFRAPIGVPLFSLDRFFHPRSWILFINMILVAFVPGILFPLIHFKIRDLFLLDGWTVPYFVIAGIGFLSSIALVKLFFKETDIRKQVIWGLTMLVLAVSLFILSASQLTQIISALLLGVALGVVTPVLLLMFINLSRHCQRGTANVSSLLSWEIGISLGVATSCYLHVQSLSNLAFQLAMFSAALALIFFIAISYPYYKKNV